MTLDAAAAEKAMARLGGAIGLPADAIARGIFNLVNEAMAGAARVHIAEKAFDPRRFTMVATGGAGPVHAVEIARKLQISSVLFPIAAGAGSCLGFIAAPTRVDRSWSKPARLAAIDWPQLDETLAALKREAELEIASGSAAKEEIVWSVAAEIRYLGQGFSLVVSLPFTAMSAELAGTLEAEFQKAYEAVYGAVLPNGQLEVVTWRITGSTRKDLTSFVWPVSGQNAIAKSAGRRRIFCTDVAEMREVAVYRRYQLPAATRLTAPLILEENESTIVVPVAGEVEILENLSVLVRLKS
jgi:N-methylhydantoinase A